jgi:hypothetical protein
MQENCVGTVYAAVTSQRLILYWLKKTRLDRLAVPGFEQLSDTPIQLHIMKNSSLKNTFIA